MVDWPVGRDPIGHYPEIGCRGIVGSASQPLSSKSNPISRREVFRPAMLTLFPFCHLQFCRLSFFPYVIKLASDAESSMGGRVGQEIEKTRTGA